MRHGRFFGRLAAAALLLFVLAAVLAVGLGVLAYGTGPKRTGDLDVPALQSRVALAWPDDGPVVVEAGDEAGLWAGLGYAHAADHAWSMALWRQMALGNLAAWFPERGALDRHARLLGFASLARDTYRRLSDADRAALDAYALGVQAALSQPGVAQSDEFVLVDARPERWEPWHALAVERLIAWLGTTPPGRDTAYAAAAAADSSLAAFARADSAFRAYLALGEFDHARAFAARIGGQGSLVVELPWGRSALPLFSEALLRRGGASMLVATVPGTLSLHAGHGLEQSWVIFPTSNVVYAPFQGSPPAPDYDRLIDRNGDETLLTIPRSVDGLFLAGMARRAPTPTPTPVQDTSGRPAAATDTSGAPPPPVASAVRQTAVWRVTWPGFAPGSDVPAWRSMLEEGTSPAFTLFAGHGMRAGRDSAPAVVGTPVVRRDLPDGVFVAGVASAAYSGARLQELLASGRADSLTAYLDDTYSPWAAGLLGPLVEALGERDALPEPLLDPYAFLRGWDGRYSADAIGASVFEAWLTTYRIATGTLPPAAPDSSDGEILRWTLGIAADRLSTVYGAEPAGWRWERVQRGNLVFPVWLARDAGRAAERYATVPAGRGGHPTTLLPGPSLTLGGAPGVWTLWATETTWARPTLRRPHIKTHGFLARARSADREGAPVVVQMDARPEDVLTLRPAGG